jgi:hypothetical protein
VIYSGPLEKYVCGKEETAAAAAGLRMKMRKQQKRGESLPSLDLRPFASENEVGTHAS